MDKLRRYLENRGMIVPNDNTVVVKPEVFNISNQRVPYSKFHREYSNAELGYNMYGQLIDYNTGNLIDVNDAENIIRRRLKDKPRLIFKNYFNNVKRK